MALLLKVLDLFVIKNINYFGKYFVAFFNWINNYKVS